MIKRKGGKRAVRRIFLLIAFCVFINNMLACTFDKNQANLTANAIDKSSFSVTYINVGMGDATFINFGDGKNMLIDVGSDTDFAYNNLTNTLDYFGVDKIDYLILTHPDSEHIGNAKKILNNYLVDKLYLSNVSDEVFLDLKEIKSAATFKNVNIIYSDYKTHFNINGAKV
ncbi:MAG: MBL fold metallo-hydrolase, partial [Clostridia bacterium]|nr:MBL fold metallo-hydrolase [Clostridia bacterium]